jgi:hypothetical protein
MKPEIERLMEQHSEAFCEVERLENAIAALRRVCNHVRDPQDLNWCQECGASLPANYETR